MLSLDRESLSIGIILKGSVPFPFRFDFHLLEIAAFKFGKAVLVEGYAVEHHHDGVVHFPVLSVVEGIGETLFLDVRGAIAFYPHTLWQVDAVVVAVALAPLLVGLVLHQHSLTPDPSPTGEGSGYFGFCFIVLKVKTPLALRRMATGRRALLGNGIGGEALRSKGHDCQCGHGDGERCTEHAPSVGFCLLHHVDSFFE